MPTATLTFNLPDDRIEHTYAVHAVDYVVALSGIQEYLRNLHRRGHSFADTDQAIEQIYQMVCDEVASCPPVE